MIYHEHVFCLSQSLNKHTGPIWQLRWVELASGETEDRKRERLICMSADGRITEWFLQKRLDCIGKHFPCRGIRPEMAVASFYFR